MPRLQPHLLHGVILSNCVIFAALNLHADVLRDQYFAAGTGWGKASSTRDMAQTFHITLDGYLDSIDVNINHQARTPGTMFWDIRPLVNGIPNDSNASSLVSGSIPVIDLPTYPNTDPISLDVSEARIRVHPGDELAIVIRSTGEAYWLSHWAAKPNHGRRYERFSYRPAWTLETLVPERPRGFATYVRLIPEPSSLTLLCLGSVCLLKRPN